MNAIRCISCGDTRWSILGIGKRDPGSCEICGGKMVLERRRPERGPARLSSERRDITKRLGPPPGVRPSA